MNVLAYVADQMNALLIRIGADQWFATIGLTSNDVVNGTLSISGGIFCGVIAKRYFRALFWATLLTVVVIMFLEHKKVLNINWTAFNVLLGLDATATFDSLLNMVFEWIKLNAFVSITGFIGFLIGLKVS